MLFRICSVFVLLVVVALSGCLGDTAFRAGHPCRNDTDCISAGADLFCNDSNLCEAEACTTETRTCYVGGVGCDKDGKNCVGACKAGTQTCNAGFWGKCEGQVIPTADICDGIDNDCDGTTDEGAADNTICTVTDAQNKIATGAGGLNACTDKKVTCTIDPVALCGAKEADCAVTPALVYIAAAGKNFRMGVKPSPSGIPPREPDEGSATNDVSRDFEYNFGIGQTEVTQEQFKAVMGYLPADLAATGDDHPVHNITWHEAALYTVLLSEKHGLDGCFKCDDFDPAAGKPFVGTCLVKGFDEPQQYVNTCNGFRLPTESEWSYAYRAQDDGGIYKDYHNGDMEQPTEKNNYKDSRLGQIATYSDNSGNKPTEVRSHDPNAWQLFDMSGNVGEWVVDRYAASLSSAGNKESNSTGPNDNTIKERVWRGGHYLSPPYDCRGARRNKLAPEEKQATLSASKAGLGFRIARSLLKAK